MESISTDATETAVRKMLRKLTAKEEVEGIALASVVPGAIGRWDKALRAETGLAPLVIDHTVDLGVRIDYPRPEQIGADRLANAAGGMRRYGAPVVVADFGTALTFDIVSAQGKYVGGIIAPGVPLMFEYLAEKTALLPRIDPGNTRRMIGKSTEEAMRIGARWGYYGMFREILKRLRMRMHAPDLPVCATGGYARWVLENAEETVRIDPHITLFGLGTIFERNA